MTVAFPSPLWHTKTFLFLRTRSRDFSERDRLVLDRLQPHFARIWQAARTRRLLKTALASMDQASEQGRLGVILVGAAAEVEFASAPARASCASSFRAAEPGAFRASSESGSSWERSDHSSVGVATGS
jgi:hypothetical protein